MFVKIFYIYFIRQSLQRDLGGERVQPGEGGGAELLPLLKLLAALSPPPPAAAVWRAV
jgi:hypothetical protein